MPRGPLSNPGGPKVKKEKKPKIPKEERVKRAKKPPHPDNIAPDRKLFGTKTAHAKWPAMLKRQLGMVETHIRTIDRVMQSMQSSMNTMDSEERALWESGQKGNWILACGMMQRAQQVLKDTRLCAAGVLPPKNLKEKKSLGSMAAVAERYVAGPRPVNWIPEYDPAANPPAVEDSDSDSDSDSSSTSASSDSSSDSDAEKEVAMPERKKSPTPQVEPAAYKPLNLNKKRKLSEDDDEKNNEAERVEANPYFVVDTNPTPINLRNSNGAAPSKKPKKKHDPNSDSTDSTKGKKRSSDEDSEAAPPKKSKQDKSTSDISTQARAEQVDFSAVERQLQAEVAAGLEAQAKAKAKKEKKIEKKRKRVSDGSVTAEVVGKKAKKDKAGKEKPKADDEVAVIEDGVVEEGGKKKSKHKVEE